MACGFALFDTPAAGNSLITPAHASTGIAGDIDIRALVAPITWIPVDFNAIVVRMISEDENNQSYEFGVTDEGRLGLRWWDTLLDDHRELESDAAGPPGADGASVWVRVTLDVDNGASAAVARFYTSADQPETASASVVWTQYGPDMSGAVAAISIPDLPVTLGGYNDGSSGQYGGKIFYVEIRNGINGVVVADPDFRNPTQKTGDTPTTFTDTTGKVWTFDPDDQWGNPTWVPGDCGGSSAGRRKTRPPRNPRRYQV